MPGTLLNFSLSNLSGGVTQQYQEGRFDSQVSEMVNCVPSITRGVIRRNPLSLVKALDSSVDYSNSFVYAYDRGTVNEQYILIIPGDGSLYIYNANDGELKHSTTDNDYLNSTFSAKYAFAAITVGDHTFILNKEVTVAFDTTKIADSNGYSDMAFYWIKKTTSVVSKQVQDNDDIGNLTLGYDYTLNGITVHGKADTRPGHTEVHLDTTELIADKFTEYSDSLAPKSGKSVAYNDAFDGTDWSWNDTYGDEASLGVWKTLDDATKLPVNLPQDLDGFKVRISGGTSGEYDDFFLAYSYENKTWAEIPAPGAYVALKGSTMPHVVYRMADGTFKFDMYQEVSDDGLSLTGVSMWTERSTGGEDPLDDPSFVGTKITGMSFFRNRLCFITGDSIILSSTGDYGNFFPQTLQNVLDDDPIDLTVATTEVTVLRTAVPIASQLILFSDDTQFVLDSSDDILTPNTANILALSNYTYEGSKAQAKAIGNKIYFSNRAGGYSQVYTYSLANNALQTTYATPITLHIPSYIDKDVSNILGHDVLGYVFLELDSAKDEVIVLTTTSSGDKQLQLAWHKWKLPKEYAATFIINNDYYVLFNTGELCKMVLEIPGEISDVTYVDTLDAEYTYTSYIKFSEFFYRNSGGKGTPRGRLQLRTMLYSVTDNSYFKTTILNNRLSTTNVDLTLKREYFNDKKITVTSNSKDVSIVFSEDTTNPTKGFELANVNVEAFFYQRSHRVN